MIPTTEIQVIGVPRLLVDDEHHHEESDAKQRQRRRRRRHNRNNSKATVNHHHDDSSTCATVSSSSDDHSSSTSCCSNDEQHPQHEPLTPTPPSPRTQQQRQLRRQRKQQQPSKNKKKQQHQQHDEMSAEVQAQYVALDCEMVGVESEDGGHEASSVARVTIVGWDGTILFDEFVKQDQKVVDYRTFVSGVTETDLQDASMTLQDIRRCVMNVISDKVLVGHALKNDLRALGITHPWYATRDTAKYEPFMQVRFDDGILWPRKLRDLVHEQLDRDIQIPGRPHSAYEDAVAAMDLYRLVRTKWEKVMEYKIKKTKEIESQNK
jgi:RNA exonuclease 4